MRLTLSQVMQCGLCRILKTVRMREPRAKKRRNHRSSQTRRHVQDHAPDDTNATEIVPFHTKFAALL